MKLIDLRKTFNNIISFILSGIKEDTVAIRSKTDQITFEGDSVKVFVSNQIDLTTVESLLNDIKSFAQSIDENTDQLESKIDSVITAINDSSSLNHSDLLDVIAELQILDSNTDNIELQLATIISNTSGIATSANQTNGFQKTQIVNSLGDEIGQDIMDELISFIDFGSVGNIPAALNSTLEIDNSEGYNSIAFHLVPPTGGRIRFEGTFDGVNWTPITIREVGTNGYVQTSAIEEDYIGSISCLRKLRFVVITGGSTDGTIRGRITDNVSTIEGIEHAAAPHNFGYEIKHVDFEFITAQTNTAILTPVSGKKWVITDILFTSDGVNDITIFDETNVAGNIIVKIKTGQERFFNHPFKGVIKSAAVNNRLRVTSTSNSDFRGTIIYYEIE